MQTGLKARAFSTPIKTDSLGCFGIGRVSFRNRRNCSGRCHHDRGLCDGACDIWGVHIWTGLTTSTGASLIGLGLATTTYHAQDLKPPSVTYKNGNPFDGPVDESTIVVDPQGNAIPVKEGNWLTGSPDGKWIQEMEPCDNAEGRASGTRKDGGHPPGPKHPDPRAWEPHGHVPGVTNPDGTPWLPIH